MHFSEPILKELGIFQDFKTILKAIENHDELTVSNIQNEAARKFNLEINNEEEAEKLFKIKN